MYGRTLPPGARRWNSASPRAIAPGAALSRARHPESASAAHASASRLPYGLGVIVDGTPVPLVHVSETAAARRGPGVEPGWYVAAHPGSSFELALTRVHNRLRDAKPAPGFGVVAELLVGGVSVAPGGYRVSCERTELRVRGFSEGLRFKVDRNAGHDTVLPFVFKRAPTVDASEHADNAADNSGHIRLVVYSGLLRVATRSSVCTKPSRARGARAVHEKVALKHGRSIAVDAAKCRVDVVAPRAALFVPLNGAVIEGSITIFLRERFWLESRRIIDAKGGPWRPVVNAASIDVDGGCVKKEVRQMTLDTSQVKLEKPKEEPVSAVSFETNVNDEVKDEVKVVRHQVFTVDDESEINGTSLRSSVKRTVDDVSPTSVMRKRPVKIRDFINLTS